MFPTKEMDKVASGFKGRMGFYIEDLKSGAVHMYNPDQRFPTASVCKVPVMIELYRQVEAGKLSLDDRRMLRDDISSHGTGMLKLMVDQPEFTLRDYCRMMISVSDNMATDMVIDAVGLENVNKTVESLGFSNTRTNMSMSEWHYAISGVRDWPISRRNNRLVHERLVAGKIDFTGMPYTDSLDNNVTTPREIAAIMKQLVQGKIVSKKASEGMVEMLKLCRDRSVIPAQLKAEVETAHKVGFTRRVKADSGIVYLPSGPLVIAGFTLASEDPDGGDKAIAEVARLAVRALSPESVSA
ncbi:MAG: serine hydrolase [SAR202 cluster bacterium]|nr:serine hydrolase [SAR202 cluster bacterium]